MDNNYVILTENLGFCYPTDDDDVVANLAALDTPPALEGVNLSVKRGEYVAVLGHNGSGKSTLAKLLNMILVPPVGKVFINGRDITDEN